MWKTHYDVLIVGGGVAGCSLAYALSSSSPLASSSSRPAKPLRIAVLERSLAEPDRIVGELLQPGGVAALTSIGMASCLEGIGAVKVKGYCVVKAGENVHIPYPDGREGSAFHHGRFIQSLRAKAKEGEGVEMIEATVNELIECPFSGRVLGVEATRSISSEASEAEKEKAKEKESFFADIVVVADGCFSNFRTSVMGKGAIKPTVRSHFVGIVVKDAKLPYDNHGTVCLVKGNGPVLLYSIEEHDTRMLIDITAPLPSDLKEYIWSKIVPQLPPSLHTPIHNALQNDRLRRMPNSWLPAAPQGTSHTKEGVILLGDSWNMRHPLTGGGMTVAFNDVAILGRLLKEVAALGWSAEGRGGSEGGGLGDWENVKWALDKWWWERKGMAATINILSVALYDLFGAEDECLEVLRAGCFKYFERGGECVRGPVSLLSGIAPSPVLLFNHFFAVAFYSIWCMFTHPQPYTVAGSEKVLYKVPRLDQYPMLVIKSFQVFWTACIVFGPLLWTEVRW
ncbi:hypothetical protein JAAARDRAFT_150938 [Jaapia argillacea MUCL 33604]|uniref:Squalene monooxygenase n=1 Tax=Jaapia argillacea MUCL 33604 TaxID=933084 RepID=A0A067QEQ3_9AGAM|nr:hypothetical protein JAAARDRAFT_150938 [Jaapia argillacea MUCL 33604]